MRLAKVAQAGMRFVLELVFERRGEARFADARLAGQQHDAAFALLDLQPAPPQQLDLLVAADQRGKAYSAQGLEAAGDGALAQHPKSADRFCKTLQRRRRDGLIFE